MISLDNVAGEKLERFVAITFQLDASTSAKYVHEAFRWSIRRKRIKYSMIIPRDSCGGDGLAAKWPKRETVDVQLPFSISEDLLVAWQVDQEQVAPFYGSSMK